MPRDTRAAAAARKSSGGASKAAGVLRGPALRGVRAVRRGAFTLLEILIATAILTIGLASIVALFPAAINVGRQVIETSNAVVVAQSVAEAVRDGMRNRRGYWKETANEFFVLEHDGVTDPVPANLGNADPSHDYYIALPRHSEGRQFDGRSEEGRFAALRAGKVFVYPETDSKPNGGGDVLRADNDADDDGDDDLWTLKIEDVYRLGDALVREELPSGSRLRDMEQDVLNQYSFALVVMPSFFDADESDTRRRFDPANKLYHVRILVFREFQVTEYTQQPEPVYELDFEVST